MMGGAKSLNLPMMLSKRHGEDLGKGASAHEPHMGILVDVTKCCWKAIGGIGTVSLVGKPTTEVVWAVIHLPIVKSFAWIPATNQHAGPLKFWSIAKRMCLAIKATKADSLFEQTGLRVYCSIICVWMWGKTQTRSLSIPVIQPNIQWVLSVFYAKKLRGI